MKKETVSAQYNKNKFLEPFFAVFVDKPHLPCYNDRTSSKESRFAAFVS